MCEVLLQVIDKTNQTSTTTDAGCYKAGDIVTVCPDGWKWTPFELSNPEWVVVKLPTISVDTFNDMLQATRDGELKFLRRRDRAIDMTKPIIQETLASLNPLNRVYTLTTNPKRTAFLAARYTKPTVTTTVVLG